MCSELSNEIRKARICEGQCSNSEILNSVSCENFEECRRTPIIDEDDQLPSHYLEKNIFYLLLPAVEETLKEASRWNALRIQKCRFNGLDYIAELLWNFNPRRSKIHSPLLNVFEIPAFKEYLLQHPRPYYPKSWLWSEGHAALRIQRYVRGWLVRKREDVQEMRQFWKVDILYFTLFYIASRYIPLYTCVSLNRISLGKNWISCQDHQVYFVLCL
nr:PREDICTED: IQ domain-containing protein K-like [Megachile rotundata]